MSDSMADGEKWRGKHPDGPDAGHGRIFPRLDGVTAKCGGLSMCFECKADAFALHYMEVLEERAKQAQPLPIMRHFAFEHLPPHLAKISRPFSELARDIAGRVVHDIAERDEALRKLLEAKDCAVRAMLPLKPSGG